jgi:hypothetical protein
LAISTPNHPNLVKVRDWRHQGVEIKDLLKFQRIQVLFPLSPRYSKELFPIYFPRVVLVVSS